MWPATLPHSFNTPTTVIYTTSACRRRERHGSQQLRQRRGKHLVDRAQRLAVVPEQVRSGPTGAWHAEPRLYACVAAVRHLCRSSGSSDSGSGNPRHAVSAGRARAQKHRSRTRTYAPLCNNTHTTPHTGRHHTQVHSVSTPDSNACTQCEWERSMPWNCSGPPHLECLGTPLYASRQGFSRWAWRRRTGSRRPANTARVTGKAALNSREQRVTDSASDPAAFTAQERHERCTPSPRQRSTTT